jgi:amidase
VVTSLLYRHELEDLMRRLFLGLLGVLSPVTLLAQPASLSGDWQATVHLFGSTQYAVLHLEQTDDKVTGTIFGTKIECQLQSGVCSGTVRDGTKPPNGTIKMTLRGPEIQAEGSDDHGPFEFVARRPPATGGTPRTHQFTPTTFYNYFASRYEPVLHIAPGDTVETWSVDAGGVDASGERRSPGGNPLTGPFFVDGAWPGDTLVVRLNRIRTNRTWANSGSTVMSNALEPNHLAGLKWTETFNSRWAIDADAGVARLEQPPDSLKDFVVPLKPMLGCVAVAPAQDGAIRTTDSGRFGGNIDYNQIVEGTTVYLPVYHPGALLFVGDGHAAQGDGELTGDALETSMDIEFTVDVIEGRSVGQPLAENAEYLISVGIGGSLDQALQMATSGMMRWLERDYKLTATEAAIVVGFAMKYDVVDLVGTQVSIAAKLPRSALAKLRKAS